MREFDALFGAYEHLSYLPKGADALHTLRKIASTVKPIMRKRGWRVGTLCEFLPDEPTLQGLNINHTERICIRLRYSAESSKFLPLDFVVDTLLHELSHIVFGPHDAKFHALWNELRNEHLALISKGYTGDGYLTQGHRVGGKGVPVDELRRQARTAAETRRKQTRSSGKRLGGEHAAGGVDMRKIIAEAASRRGAITKGCALGSKEATKAAEEARRNGFRTKAEEDDANDLAITQALIELMEIEELHKLEGRDDTSDFEIVETEGLNWNSERGLEPASARPSASNSRTPSSSGGSSRPVSRLVDEAGRKRVGSRSASSSDPDVPGTGRGSPANEFEREPEPYSLWSCSICTLINPANYLCCEACGIERCSDTIFLSDSRKPKTRSTMPPATRPTMPPATRPTAPLASRPSLPLGWNCRRCRSFMESQWWTCSSCGTLKVSS